MLEHRFYSATPARCYRNIRIPFSVNHPSVPSPASQAEKKFKEIMFQKNLIDQQFVAWLNSLGLDIKLGRVFLNYPNQVYTLHVDQPKVNDQSVALNFAFNDHGTAFSWYNAKEGTEVIRQNNLNNIIIYNFNPDDCVAVLEEEIIHEHNQPFLVNTGYIHSLKVGNSERFCYSYFIKKLSDGSDLQWDDAVEYFKDFIY